MKFTFFQIWMKNRVVYAWLHWFEHSISLLIYQKPTAEYQYNVSFSSNMYIWIFFTPSCLASLKQLLHCSCGCCLFQLKLQLMGKTLYSCTHTQTVTHPGDSMYFLGNNGLSFPCHISPPLSLISSTTWLAEEQTVPLYPLNTWHIHTHCKLTDGEAQWLRGSTREFCGWCSCWLTCDVKKKQNKSEQHSLGQVSKITW